MEPMMILISAMLVGSSITMALMELGAAVIMPGIDRWSRRFFIVFFSALVAYTGTIVVEAFISMRQDLRVLMEIVSYIESLLPSIMIVMIPVYLLHICGERWQTSRLMYMVAAMWTAYFIMLNISPFTTWFYYYTPEMELCRGPYYGLMLAFVLAMLAFILAGVIRRRTRLSGRYYYAFLVALIPMFVTVLIHVFVSVFMFFGIGMDICMFSMFTIILSDQIEQYMYQQREIAHQQASIMILQMRPHFIYNTMMSIYYLCKQNPDQAQRVTLDFTTYLRKNFTAIASDKAILFSEELEHTRAYLAVEQAQFEDSLFVEYDTPHIDFFVPPLTLQPIVENAVKHGMDPDADPLHIFIRTQSTDSGSEIIVENTGADFEPADDSEPHIALKNIRQRLEMMCRGTLMIMPREGGGTVVKVKIPA